MALLGKKKGRSGIVKQWFSVRDSPAFLTAPPTLGGRVGISGGTFDFWLLQLGKCC